MLSVIAKEISSVGDLCRKFEGTDDEIRTAADAYLEVGAEPFVPKSGHRVDVT